MYAIFCAAALISGGTLEVAAIPRYCCCLCVLTRNGPHRDRIVTQPHSALQIRQPNSKTLRLLPSRSRQMPVRFAKHCGCLCRLACFGCMDLFRSALPATFAGIAHLTLSPDYICHALSGDVRAKETQTQLPQPKWAHQRLKANSPISPKHRPCIHKISFQLFDVACRPYSAHPYSGESKRKICRARKKWPNNRLCALNKLLI